jgi:hypothetical protein
LSLCIHSKSGTTIPPLKGICDDIPLQRGSKLLVENHIQYINNKAPFASSAFSMTWQLRCHALRCQDSYPLAIGTPRSAIAVQRYDTIIIIKLLEEQSAGFRKRNKVCKRPSHKSDYAALRNYYCGTIWESTNQRSKGDWELCNTSTTVEQERQIYGRSNNV